MIEITTFTWFLIVFGIIINLPLIYAQTLMGLRPQSQKTKDLIIGKGKDWRDKSNMEFSLGFAWADLFVYFPLLIAGSVGVVLGELWGYVLYAAVGVTAIYFSIAFWIAERKYTLPSIGAFSYYTYYWGFWLYWGITVVIYSILRLEDVILQ